MHPDQRLPDSEMEAILGVLKANGGEPSPEQPPERPTDQEQPTGQEQAEEV
jgi:hypothetical protein